MEHKMETKNCQNCKKDFTIEPDDFGFYEKIKVPPPTFCPECRRQRRWAWRNNMSLYNRKCELCGKGVISLYAPDSKIIIYCNKCWWSDKWDSKSYAIDYDFSRPFFTQFRELIGKVPHMSIVNDDGIASLNCEYNQDWWFSKNCYMNFSGWHVENVMYSFFILAGRDMMDCMNIRSKSEWLYECMIVSLSYQTKYSQFCLASIDSQFLYDCRNCSNCFMCAGIHDKKFCFRNEQYEKEEYEKILKNYQLDTFSGVEKAQREYDDFISKYPRRLANNLRNDGNVTGDVISYSKNLKNCFVGKKSENVRYSDLFTEDKDCADITLTGESSECYDGTVMDHSQLNFFGLFSVKSQDIRYTQHCHNAKHCFGCVGLRNASYCIFNKQYTKEEYEKLRAQIIEQMNTKPYISKDGATYRYGEFFPRELSPFAYNESMLNDLFPLSKEEAEGDGYLWREQEVKEHVTTMESKNLPDTIAGVTDEILKELVKCSGCGKAYRFIPQELAFYKRIDVPLPRRCFNCRFQRRLALMNPIQFRNAVCHCAGKKDKSGIYANNTAHVHAEGACPNTFETSYPEDKGDIVYCEACYQAEVL